LTCLFGASLDNVGIFDELLNGASECHICN
jgi:hypothetical protein